MFLTLAVFGTMFIFGVLLHLAERKSKKDMEPFEKIGDTGFVRVPPGWRGDNY